MPPQAQNAGLVRLVRLHGREGAATEPALEHRVGGWEGAHQCCASRESRRPARCASIAGGPCSAWADRVRCGRDPGPIYLAERDAQSREERLGGGAGAERTSE